MILTAQSTRLDGSVKGLDQQAYGLVNGSNSADLAQLGESTRFSGSSLPATSGGASELRLGRFWRRRIPLVETFDLICNSVDPSLPQSMVPLEMLYLQAIVKETLRLYTAAMLLDFMFQSAHA
ncbi:hypothetical protein Sjap_010484 [Stephania japonica]|uniref:Uncharacterized protein n=1 Tax=Stephania japonica TaxID=461633 RepID=A0AAP0P3P6_9MAGN